MTSVSVHEAKTHLSRLIERVLAGEEVTVTRNKEPVIRLVRAAPPPAPRRSRIGTMAGRLGSDCDAILEPWADEDLELDRWEKKDL
ncbi:type II toxin-antitoxin system Phd/YefM family antitoxin [Sphingomonas sp.]|uniref:type II toxin-antitoxin system Phd/YefM family antitoxin n=1 Tax=Sphingomonas sp. TaxID=28214 RepID=UPI0035BC5173